MFDKIDEERLSFSWRFNDMLYGDWEGSIVELFRFVSLEYYKVERSSLKKIVD